MTVPVVRTWRRSAPEPDAGWEFQVRPRRATRTAIVVAIVILVAFTAGGLLLRTGSTGVNFRVADQVAMILIGVVGAGAVLMLTRPRVRAGSQGVGVRNILGEQVYPWAYIRGASFPDRKAWARLELADDDYVPMLAIRSNDKTHAADAIERVRELGARYAPQD
ncbi:PH (Pleckstrin Homology) domain-containing protein [Nocardia fluminea]|uniref:PH (Pleckstrin Homology) domain-containing protein n=1 Tax=Nocardia fluminea TaxID=134984 RepID=A0A2N3VIE0_9NOCA|nr:PH (Pleckstrin Homology) domain-containing protein [Nocardia fluminea]